jgi:hypothetical protein
LSSLEHAGVSISVSLGTERAGSGDVLVARSFPRELVQARVEKVPNQWYKYVLSHKIAQHGNTVICLSPSGERVLVDKDVFQMLK